MKLQLATLAAGIALCATATAQVTQRVSVASDGSQAIGWGSYAPSVSADGRLVAFGSGSSNLVPGDTNGAWDVFVRDRVTGVTERVSVSSSGMQGMEGSYGPAISADGRFVAFWSEAPNLVSSDFNGRRDVFLRDRQAGSTIRLSTDSGGVEADDDSLRVSISANGQCVAFESLATNLVPGDTNGQKDIFVSDLVAGTIERVSTDSTGTEGNGVSEEARLSGDGRYVVFHSRANNLVGGDSNALGDVFLHDRITGVTERISVDSIGSEGDGDSTLPFISEDGRWVVFTSWATNLVVADSNARSDVFVRDRVLATTELASRTNGGAQGNEDSYWGSISTDGNLVAFYALATNLVSGDTNAQPDVFLRDRTSNSTLRLSVGPTGVQGDGMSTIPEITSSGRFVMFVSRATNLIPGDTNGIDDVFLHDSSGVPTFMSLCDPGFGGVIACPCGNAPSGTDRGCDNSAATGGAVLSASGGTYLSSDSLWFTTSDERPSALSIVTQWTTSNPTGTVFGQGIRCTSGTLKRLYTKQAAGGSITAPDFTSGDQQVSVRSATLGDTIHPGDSRYYLVYYRDANVLGGCPASSTFNCTQTGQVTWSP
jgi:Tol biopolymer transport system component